MADINLNINILDGAGCPTLSLIDTTDLSIVVNEDSPVLADNSITVAIPQDTTVTIVVEKTGYNSYANTIDVEAIDKSINVVLNETVAEPPITISKSCHSFVITNTGTTSDDNLTYTITDLDNTIIGDNEDVELIYSASKTFTSSSDNIYILIIKNADEEIIANYIIIDYCTVLQCISNKISDVLCDCDCHTNNCEDFCKRDFELKRIFLLGFDILSRINKEYRLNSLYSTIEDAKVQELKTAKEEIDKLNTYCSTCGDSSTTTTGTSVLNITTNTSTTGCGC